MKKQFGLGVAAAVLSLAAIAAPAFAATISTQMDIGTQDGDVTTLQQAFAANPSIYPQGLVTGYFGPLTSQAVTNFQAAQGLPQVGRVGPLTIAAFNQVYGGTVSGTTQDPIISAVSIAPNSSGTSLLWTTNQNATGLVYYSTSPLQVSEATGPGQAVTVNGTNVLSASSASGTSNSLLLTNLSTNTTYYYMIESVSPSGVSVTWPSTFTTAQ